VISPSQKPLPDNTQHSQETDIHALGGIGTHNPSKRAVMIDTKVKVKAVTAVTIGIAFSIFDAV
jgi:hypothetical protein